MKTTDKVFDIEWLKKYDTKELTFEKVSKRGMVLRAIRYKYKGKTYEFNVKFEPMIELTFIEKYDADTDEEREAYSLMYKHLREILKQHPLLKIPLRVGLNFGVGDDIDHHPFRISNFEFYEKMKDEMFLRELALKVLNIINETKKEHENKRRERNSRDIYLFGNVGKNLIEELSKIDQDILLVHEKNDPLANFLVLKGDWTKVDGFTVALYKKLKSMGISAYFGTGLLHFSYS